MYRYHILIEYVGTNFIGWQIQKKGRSIQGTIQLIISKILKEKIILYGSGRTDSSVHAIEQSAHFDTKTKILDLKKFLGTLNFFLNKKLISVINIKIKNKKFHSRYSAKKRIYKYIIFNRNSMPSIQRNRVWHIRNKIDVNLMKKGAIKLVGTHDFSSFRASSCTAKSPIKTMDYVKIKKNKNMIELKFKSQSFLQQQVRSMVGCLKYLGEKKWNIKKFVKVFQSKNKNMCAPPAPAHGLFLEKVIY